LDVVVAVSTEGGDEKGGVVVKGIVPGNGEEEVSLDVLVLRTPDLLTAFVDNGVLMRVVGDGSGTRRGSKEMGEELGFWGDGERKVWEDRSGWGGGGDNGNGSFNNGQQEVFYGDVSEGNSLNDFLKLEVDVGILLFDSRGVLKLRAYDISLLRGNISEDVEEVRQGDDDGGRGLGAVGVRARSRTIQVVLDNLVGGGNVDLISIVDLRPVGNREGRGDDKGW
jgi:hypothetical protein